MGEEFQVARSKKDTMGSKGVKSWSIQSTVDLVKELGPREDTSKCFKTFKTWLKILRERGLIPSGVWEPPGCRMEIRMKGEANDSLRELVDLRVSRLLSLPSDRQNETHRKLLEAVGEFQRKINLQEKQVALDRA